jgi:putative transcriptional regulator
MGKENQTDWARLEAMTDEEALQNALDDPDSQPLTPDQRSRLRRVPNPKAIRLAMGLSQEAFARRFEIAVGMLRDWEQRAHIPDSTAKAYLRVIEADPDAVVQAWPGDGEVRFLTRGEQRERCARGRFARGAQRPLTRPTPDGRSVRRRQADRD